MLVVFCCDALFPKKVDEAWTEEAKAARTAGFSTGLVDYDAFVSGDHGEAVRKVPKQPEPVSAIYRGWMLKPSQYERLYGLLKKRGVELINNPTAYKHCHYLPESYGVIAEQTPKTHWIPNDTLNPESIADGLARFGEKPVMVKDYVKSQKHYWDQACYIPNAARHEHAVGVIERFRELQDHQLEGGLVLREFVPFQPMGEHQKSGMPLTLEYRIFFFNGKKLLTAPYWRDGDYSPEKAPPQALFNQLAPAINSRFFSMDVALTETGSWMIVELGDGQVSGLQEHAASAFYEALAKG